MWSSSEQVLYSTPEPQHSFLDDDDMCGPGSSTFEDLAGDSVINFSLFKIAKFALSEDKRERFLFAEGLPRTVEGLKGKAGEFVIGLVEGLIDDEAEIAGEMLSRLEEVVKVWVKGEKEYADMTKLLLPMVWKKLYDPNETLSKKASDAYTKLLSFLTPEDRGTIALTQLLTIAHEEEKESAKILAIKVLNDAAPLFGRGLCEQFLASELMALADDNSEAVRKTVAGSMRGVFSCVKAPVAQSKLIPALERLAKDQKISVRRAVIEALPSLSQVSLPSLFSPIFSLLLKDKNKTVKILTSMRSGPFSASLAGFAPLPDDVLRAFLDQCSAGGQQEDSVLVCAQYFPAVILALGISRWSEVAKAYASLATHPSKPVRKTIAAGIHEVARVIGSRQADKDLIPVYTNLTGKNEVEEVKAVALGVFAKFLGCLSVEKRAKFGDIVNWMVMARPNWRFRELLARQLAELAVEFDRKTAKGELWEAGRKLMKDIVAAVYIPAAQGMGALTTRLLRDSGKHTSEIKTLLSSLQTDSSHQKRLLFGHMCSTAVFDADCFKQYYREGFEKGCKDVVPAVRLVCAEVVRRREWEFGELGEELRTDKDAEVRKTMERREVGDGDMIMKVAVFTEEHLWSEALNFTSTSPPSFIYLESDTLLDDSNFPLWQPGG